MKNFFLIILLFFTIISCKKEKVIETPLSLLNGIKELRYLPDDSSTLQYTMEGDGITILEERSHNFIYKGFRESTLFPKITSDWLLYRLFTFNASDQLIRYKEFSSVRPGKPNRLDTCIYVNNRLVKKESKSYWLNADGMLTSDYPLWVTKKYYDYDSRNRIITEIDSVYIAHDITVNTGMLFQADPKLVYINTISNSYNDRNELTEQKTISTKDNSLTYSNGRSAYEVSNPGKVYNGTTTFSYTYNKTNELLAKNSIFKDSSTGKVYESIFTYSYDHYSF